MKLILKFGLAALLVAFLAVPSLAQKTAWRRNYTSCCILPGTASSTVSGGALRDPNQGANLSSRP